MQITRRVLLGSAAAGLCSASALEATSKSEWPTRPVKLVCPYAPGGASDISLRIFAEELGQRFGGKFIVENKPGAGTRIANETVARAEPDGYTFLYVAAPYSTAEALYGKLSYDPAKDLQPVAMAVLAPLFLIVNAKAPYTTLAEFIAYAKGKPDGITVASPGPGSQPHLAGELFFKDAGVKGLTVQFRGDAPSYTELLAGRVDATLTAISSALPHIEAGSLRVLGCASPERSAVYPQARTLREQGLGNVVAAGWYGFMAPAATPTSIRDRVEKEIRTILDDGDVGKKLLVQGLEASAKSGRDFGTFIENESRKWGELIREAGLKAG
jgi:tripartite-type tricarboxylate transporter receptor subunit TctC